MAGVNWLDRQLYSFGDVDRILALPAGTARRWINGYARNGRPYEPVVRVESQPDTNLVTWGEFIETYYLARLRQHPEPISLQHLRRVVERLRHASGHRYVFAEEGVLHADRDFLEVVRVIQDEEHMDMFLVERLSDGQLVLIPEARRRLERIEYTQGIAEKVRPRVDIDTVAVSAVENFGRPIIDGTNVSAKAVAELVQAGDSIDFIAEGYGVPTKAVFDSGLFIYGDRWRLRAA